MRWLKLEVAEEVEVMEVEAAMVEETTKLCLSMRKRICRTRRGNKGPSPVIQLQYN
jgi:hypothetical protein